MATTTKERPILFSGAMVRAILEGRKTQTRRVIKPQPDIVTSHVDAVTKVMHWRNGTINTPLIIAPDCLRRFCPYGAPGDRLWVRETWACITGDITHDAPSPSDVLAYRADDSDANDVITSARAWRPSIHMPRAYSRITLEITGVRVERVQDITVEDAIAEGVRPWHERADWPRLAFEQLWNDINAARGYGWDTNPWVWVIEFRREAPDAR